MSLFDGFDKLHIEIKGFIIGTLLIAPLWFVSIYLFHRGFFNSSPVYLPIVFSYCLTLCFSMPNLATFFFLFKAFNNKEKEKEKDGDVKKDTIDVYYAAVLISIVTISLSVIAGRGLKFNFYQFLALITFVEGLIMVLSFVGMIMATAYRKLKAKKSPNKGS